MGEISERYRNAAAQFSASVNAVPADAWDNPSPCGGWVARDVVRHLVDWMPALFFADAGIELPHGPSADDDPASAWAAPDGALQAALDDPDVAGREFESRGARFSVAQAIDTFGTPDIVLHTWDLARSTGLDERLDPDEVHRLFVAMEPIDELLRKSGHYGPRVEVPDDADEQTKLLTFIGRRP